MRGRADVACSASMCNTIVQIVEWQGDVVRVCVSYTEESRPRMGTVSVFKDRFPKVWKVFRY